MKIKIMIITHKLFSPPKSKIFIPLHVGKKGGKKLGYIGDDTGDNISEKNKNYCELTGHYWMWKNLKDLDYIGLCHYRRYLINPTKKNDLKYKITSFTRKIKGFFKNKKVWKERKVSIKSNKLLSNYISSTEEYLKKNLRNYDCILTKEFDMNITTKKLYEDNLIKKDLEVLRKVIKEKYPLYVDEYDKFLEGTKLSSCNMFIAKKEIFEDYSKWLFDILFEVEKRIEISKDPYKARVFGFMGEYLLNIYMNYHKEYKIGKMDMLFIK